MFRYLILCLLLFPCLAATAHANVPSPLGRYFVSDKPFGTGQFSFLWMTIYDISLWTDADTWSYESPFALHIQYQLEIDADDLVSTSIDEMQRNHTIVPELLKRYQQELEAVFPKVKNRDTITAVFTPHKRLTFYYNGDPVGTILDMVFARRFLDIWLHPNSRDPAQQKQLTGQSG